MDPTSQTRTSRIGLTRGISRWGNRLLLTCNVVMLAWATWFVSSRGLINFSQGFEYKDLIAILLTAIGVLLAVVALFVAVLAIWGYNAIKDAVAARAEEIAENTAREVAALIANRSGASALETVERTDDEELAAALKGGEDHG